MKAEFIKTIENDLGKLHIYKYIVVVEANTGTTASLESTYNSFLYLIETFDNKPWIYIANRLNSYAVNPTHYDYLDLFSSLKGVAIIVYDSIGKSNAELEASFCKKPFKVFNNLDHAFDWGKSLLEE